LTVFSVLPEKKSSMASLTKALPSRVSVLTVLPSFFTQTITQSGLSSFSEELVERFLNLLGFGLGSWLSGGSIGGWGLLLWGRGTGGGFLGLSVLLAFNFGSQFGSTLISTPT